MKESEKTVALKKAYAEIILNTAKEAAARIMVSEKKALRFQQDLSSTKGEALRLLVRLKQAIDAKTIDAEITSSNQQRRIDELEAQLHEAEDIITDLRTELKLVRGKLEKVKNNQGQPMNVKNTKEDAFSYPNAAPIIASSADSGLVTLTVSDMRDTLLNQNPLDNKCCNAANQTEELSVSHLESDYAHNSDLPSIIMRSKEPELYRNGCTQRICALERNLLDAKLPPSGDVDDPNSLRKNELISKTNAKDDGKCTVPSLKAKNMDMMKNYSGEGLRKPIKLCTLRRRKTQFGKAKATSRRSRPVQLMKSCQSSSVLSHCKTYPVNGNVKPDEGSHTQISIKTEKMDMVKNSSGLEEQLQHRSSFYNDKIAIIRKGKRNRRVKCRDVIPSSFVRPDNLTKPSQQSTVLTRCKTYSNLVCVNVKSCEDQLKVADNDAKIKILPRLDPGLTLIRSNVDPISGSTNVTVSVKALNRSRPNQTAADKDTELSDDSLLVTLEADSVENSMVPSPEMVNVPLLYSDLKDSKASEETNKSPGKAESNGLFKYFFQRKRKKGSFSDPDEDNCPEKSTVKRRADEKQNDVQEPQQSSLINESSRDSRRLAQVARQLISLSVKKW